ncbi:unnamed protein product, partial [marine sediment metagenome]
MGLLINISGGDGANNQYYPSEINPINGAASTFIYEPISVFFFNESYKSSDNKTTEKNKGTFGISSSGSGAINYADGIYKVVYFAFGFEAINNQGDRDLVMNNIMNYLYSDTGAPYIWAAPIDLGDIQPNGIITINAYVWDESGISSVKVEIESPDEN